jgi:hypothetical protein
MTIPQSGRVVISPVANLLQEAKSLVEGFHRKLEVVVVEQHLRWTRITPTGIQDFVSLVPRSPSSFSTIFGLVCIVNIAFCIL